MRLIHEAKSFDEFKRALRAWDERRCTVAAAEDVIRASGRDSLVVESAGAQISYGHAGAYDLSLVHVEGCISREADAEVWVGPFLGMPSFRQARLYDHEYDFWQNAEDPLEYEVAAGRSSTSP